MAFNINGDYFKHSLYNKTRRMIFGVQPINEIERAYRPETDLRQTVRKMKIETSRQTRTTRTDED